MATLSPFQIFNSWLFDGNIKTSFPEPKSDEYGNVRIPDLLKYNSPIQPTTILRYFMKDLKFNHYLNQYFNNINIRYIEKIEFFYFIKQAVIDFKFSQRQMTYFSYKKKDKIISKLSIKCPHLKSYEIDLLSELILKNENKDNILSSLGLEELKKPKKIKGKKKKKINKDYKISLDEFLNEHFAIV